MHCCSSEAQWCSLSILTRSEYRLGCTPAFDYGLSGGLLLNDLGGWEASSCPLSASSGTLLLMLFYRLPAFLHPEPTWSSFDSGRACQCSLAAGSRTCTAAWSWAPCLARPSPSSPCCSVGGACLRKRRASLSPARSSICSLCTLEVKFCYWVA